MKIYQSNEIKNISLLGSSGSGKTTLAEAMLYESGVIKRIGTVAAKNTVSDYFPVEQEYGYSVFPSVIHAEWLGKKLNFIDCPGSDDFVGGVITSTTTTYTDETFGELRVLASANSFPFGTVMRITGDRIDGSIMGIVLDRGGAMNNAWGDGEVLIDLLFATEHSSEVYEFGRQKNVKFEVLRYGR